MLVGIALEAREWSASRDKYLRHSGSLTKVHMMIYTFGGTSTTS